MTPPGIDPAMWSDFLAFQQFQASAKAQNNHNETNCKSTRLCSPTVGQSSDLADLVEEDPTDTHNTCGRSRTVGCSPNPTKRPQDWPVSCSSLPPPESGKSTCKKATPVPPSKPSSPKHTGTTPCAFAQQDKQEKRVCSPNASPARSCSPSLRRPSNHKQHCSPSPQPGLSKHCNTTSTKSKLLPPHPYNTCPTSYKQIPKKCGVCHTIMVNSKQEIWRTSIEQLMTCKAKYLHVQEHRHLFGDKHTCYFNPYSHSKVNKAICKQIARLSGFQVGCGGPNTKPIHKLIGLHGDYDFWLDIVKSICKALITFKPPGLWLGLQQNLTYKHYGSNSQTNIYNYMISRYLFLYHFCDVSGENNWAIDCFCISSLASNSSYVKSGNIKANIFLKQNESGPRGQNSGDSNNEDGDGKSSGGYKDNYTLNACVKRNVLPSAPLSHLTGADKHSCASKPNSCHYNNDLCSKKNQRESSEVRLPSPVSLLPKLS